MDRLKHVHWEGILSGIYYLHSNMDRLKPVYSQTGLPYQLNLHSNMDRLKRLDRLTPSLRILIYIPIWID